MCQLVAYRSREAAPRSKCVGQTGRQGAPFGKSGERRSVRPDGFHRVIARQELLLIAPTGVIEDHVRPLGGGSANTPDKRADDDGESRFFLDFPLYGRFVRFSGLYSATRQ